MFKFNLTVQGREVTPFYVHDAAEAEALIEGVIESVPGAALDVVDVVEAADGGAIYFYTMRQGRFTATARGVLTEVPKAGSWGYDLEASLNG